MMLLILKKEKSGFPDNFNQVPFERKIGIIFSLMGYDVEYKRCFQSYPVDIFIKKKQLFNKHDYWLCLINTGGNKVQKESVSTLVKIRATAREELNKDPGGIFYCQGMIISESGFTNEAILEARYHRIELTTLKKLIDVLERFKKEKERLLRHMESLEKR